MYSRPTSSPISDIIIIIIIIINIVLEAHKLMETLSCVKLKLHLFRLVVDCCAFVVQ